MSFSQPSGFDPSQPYSINAPGLGETHFRWAEGAEPILVSPFNTSPTHLLEQGKERWVLESLPESNISALEIGFILAEIEPELLDAVTMDSKRRLIFMAILMIPLLFFKSKKLRFFWTLGCITSFLVLPLYKTHLLWQIDNAVFSCRYVPKSQPWVSIQGGQGESLELFRSARGSNLNWKASSTIELPPTCPPHQIAKRKTFWSDEWVLNFDL